MGARIESERYLARMRDLNEDSNSCSWPPYCGRQYCPPMRDDRDAVKRTMVEHEAIFKNQVYELHRLYRVQRDMMDEFRVKELTRRRQSLFNLNCAEAVHSNFSSPNGVARRKTFDLHLPAEEYIYPDDDEHLFSVSSSRVSNTSCLDLNEPVEIQDPDDRRFICPGHSTTAPFSSSSNSNKLINGSASSAINFPLRVSTTHEVIDVDKEDDVPEPPKKQLMFDINEPCDVEEEQCGTEIKRREIDLNCSVIEEDDDDGENDGGEPDDDMATAADAIMALSSAVVDEEPGFDPLLWLAEITCVKRREYDYFESMTLNLTETKAEDYIPTTTVVGTGTGTGTGSFTRAAYPGRRARRGRQRRDFQRDILPGIASLSRHEVTEDLQAFGGAWNAPSAGRRGGRQRVTSTRSPTPSIHIDVALEGWGKATRRPRRQRCHAAAIALV